MNRRTWILLALPLLSLGIAPAKGGTIAGPSSFSSIGGTDTVWGIQFTALQNSVLTGFDYNQTPSSTSNPFFGTISVIDITSTPTSVFSTSYAAGSPTVVPFTGLNVLLQVGHKYELVATSNIFQSGNGEVYQYDSLNTPPFTFPVPDTQISVTNRYF